MTGVQTCALPICGDLWRWDFERGVVLVNPNPFAVNASLGPGYWRIAGRGVNDSSSASAVLVPANDGLFLQRR